MILDTTYLLPVVGIDVETDLFNAIEDRAVDIDLSSISISLISIFEIQAKSAKLGISWEIVSEAVDELLNRFKIVPFYNNNIMKTSFMIRREIPDYIDCIILSTAICREDSLMTEDRRILSFMEQNDGKFKIDAHPLSFYIKVQ
ncbi:MAG: PIN domain-containing protein [Thermoplasmataceae archaeon]